LQRLPDPEILKKAAAEDRILLTFDLDFGDLLALGIKKSPSVVIFRLHDETPASVNPRLLEVLNDRRTDLERGALIVVEDNRYRMRRLPIEE
jgi:predicted nuclease of predicted toxin-antitoxin system